MLLKALVTIVILVLVWGTAFGILVYGGRKTHAQNQQRKQYDDCEIWYKQAKETTSYERYGVMYLACMERNKY